MDTKSNINSSSLIDLKAELFRKQEEFKKQKLVSGSFVKGKTQDKPKPDLFSRKNKGVLERAQKDYEEKVEEEDVHAKSRRALEAKAKLYEKISSSSVIPDEDGSGLYLVDFQKKVIDTIVAKRDHAERETQSTQVCSWQGEDPPEEEIPLPSDPQDEWVDYVDSLGRSRRCMKKDLSSLVHQDKEMARVRGQSSYRPVKESSDVESPSLMSSDMHRELLRQKWEKEEQDALNNTSIHYSNVQFDEIRTHGVGFYQFDKSDEKRQEQISALNKLREQTVDERSRRERLKEKRKAVLDARLAKVKQRRKLKEGSSTTHTHAGSEGQEEIGPRLEEMLTGERNTKQEKAEEKKPVEPLTRDENLKKNAPEREWDEGKEKNRLFTTERYMSERRAERQSDFAPPAVYFNTPKVENQPTKNIETKIFIRDSKSTPLSERLPQEDSYKTVDPSDIEVGSIPLPQDIQPRSSTKVHQPSGPISDACVLPNVSVPPPGYGTFPQWTDQMNAYGSVPPGHGTTPQWTHQMFAGSNVPPGYPIYSGTGFGAPLPDVSVPPPGIVPTPTGITTSILPQSSQTGQSYGQSTSDVTVAPPDVAAGGTVKNMGGYHQRDSVLKDVADLGSSSVSSCEGKPTVYVPRTAVLDTRLVQNIDTDITNTEVPKVKAQAYKPGSFTAALQAKTQVLEDVVSASREKAHFKGGPVMYKKEPEETGGSQENEQTEAPHADNVASKTEDELTAFLREIRKTV